MEKLSYCDLIGNRSSEFIEEERTELIDAADRGERDERFDLGPGSDDEVELYITFWKAQEPLEGFHIVNFQRALLSCVITWRYF